MGGPKRAARPPTSLIGLVVVAVSMIPLFVGVWTGAPGS